MRRIYIPIFAFVFLAASTSFAFAAVGTIVTPDQYSWSDNGGYVNWLANGGNVTVTDTAITGYIWSAGFGWINLAPTDGGVMNSNGTLSGYAWGTNTGWINFAGVTIDSNGVFHGQTVAQSTFGTMTFDCTSCDVTTTWHPTPTSSGGGGSSGGGDGGNGPIPISSSSASSSLAQATSTMAGQSLIDALELQVQELSAKLTGLVTAHERTYAFTRNLQLSKTGTDVKALQQYLNTHGYLVASSGLARQGTRLPTLVARHTAHLRNSKLLTRLGSSLFQVGELARTSPAMR